MAHFAKIENGTVSNVVVVDDIYQRNGQAYLNSIGLDGQWIQASYNGNIRGVFPSIGYAYDEALDVFIAPSLPEPSGTLVVE